MSADQAKVRQAEDDYARLVVEVEAAVYYGRRSIGCGG